MKDQIEQPTTGGSYTRNADGRLTLAEPATLPAPGKSEAKAAKAKAKAPAPKSTPKSEG